MACTRKRCWNCDHYFVNKNAEKWCADKRVDANGIKTAMLVRPLGMASEGITACPRWIPSEGYKRLNGDDKGKQADKRTGRKTKKAKEEK